MDDFVCDYTCKTVGESITKHNIPDDWYAEFDICDGIYPVLIVRVDQIRKDSGMMNRKLRMVKNPDFEYAGCMVFPQKRRIIFKVDCVYDLEILE